jgi:hypothetical protein
MQYIYDSSFFTFIYHYLKSFWGFITQTSELYRICDAVVAAEKLKDSLVPENRSESTWGMLESRKISLEPEVILRMGKLFKRPVLILTM